jgi:hypothetical protein
MTEGEPITVLRNDPNGWCRAVSADGNVGWVPTSYVSFVSASEARGRGSSVRQKRKKKRKKRKKETNIAAAFCLSVGVFVFFLLCFWNNFSAKGRRKLHQPMKEPIAQRLELLLHLLFLPNC